MSEQVRRLTRWLFAVPILAVCLVYLASLDLPFWVGMSALLSALALRSVVVVAWRLSGRTTLGLMATMCLSFAGAAAATLTIICLESLPDFSVLLLTGYISALTYGTTAEIVAQVSTWALDLSRPAAD